MPWVQDELDEIAWAPGMPEKPWYGVRTSRLVLHDTARATERDRDYMSHLLCRLSPSGSLVLTGKVDPAAQEWQWR